MHPNWKIISVILLVYVFCMGLLTPIAPGIESTDSFNISEGYNQITITGHNTHFLSNRNNLQVWLDCDSFTYCGKDFNIHSEKEITFGVDIPAEVPNKNFHLLVNNETDGTLFLEDAFRVDSVLIAKDLAVAAHCYRPVLNEEMTSLHFPNLPVLYETVRNLFFHVPMWFAMMLIMAVSVVYSILYLKSSDLKYDWISEEAVKTGLIFTLLGLVSGSIWARFTWGAWWPNDPQLNGALTVFLIYLAYIILRGTIKEEEKRAKLSSVYNIFAFAMLIILIMIMPNFTESLHPGKDGNPAFSTYDLDNSLRLVFYPAVIGWILLSLWIFDIRLRIRKIQEALYEN